MDPWYMNPWLWVSLALYILGAYSFMVLHTQLATQNIKIRHTPKLVKYLLAAFWPPLVFWAFLEEI